MASERAQYRQLFDDLQVQSAKKMTAELRYCVSLLGIDRRGGETSDFLGGAHRLERARDNLARSRPIHVVGRFRFEQFCVRQDDPELIVEAVEQETQFG
ncbi:MAG: hypothetical protein LAO77_14645 [Acidobacteriia bacterium]|nr:hypothetical protein [Terriglobia bacterium]